MGGTISESVSSRTESTGQSQDGFCDRRSCWICPCGGTCAGEQVHHGHEKVHHGIVTGRKGTISESVSSRTESNVQSQDGFCDHRSCWLCPCGGTCAGEKVHHGHEKVHHGIVTGRKGTISESVSSRTESNV